MPTMSATAVGAPAKARRSWLLYAGVPLVAISVGAFAWQARHRPVSAGTHAPETPATAQTQVAQTPAPTTTLASTITTTNPEPTTTSTTRDVPITMRRVAATAPMTTSAPPIEKTPPPPPPTIETSAPPPPPVVTIAATSAPPPPVITVQHADPARVHVDIGPIQADRVGAASVDTALRHVDFTGCYRTEVAAQREAAGTATLVVDMDEERITRAELAGGAFSSSLRQCISQRTLGTRIRSADTGGASAKVTLRFALR
jgi:hypothetical protein